MAGGGKTLDSRDGAGVDATPNQAKELLLLALQIFNQTLMHSLMTGEKSDLVADNNTAGLQISGVDLAAVRFPLSNSQATAILFRSVRTYLLTVAMNWSLGIQETDSTEYSHESSGLPYRPLSDLATNATHQICMVAAAAQGVISLLRESVDTLSEIEEMAVLGLERAIQDVDKTLNEIHEHAW